jgi:glycosyltransferase involved in cell wall biosynthesis
MRILFVSHSATRNGATILLLHLLRWFRDHTDFQLEILVNDDGELLSEFRAIGRTIVWRSPLSFLNGHLRNTWKDQLESHFLHWRMLGRSYDLIYFNTAAVASQLPILAVRGRSVLWHIHELEYALHSTIGAEQIRSLFPLATRFVVASHCVGDTLAKVFGVPRDKMDVVHEFIPLPVVSAEDAQSRRRTIRRKLGWPDDAFVVGGCGGLGWRKGTDLFLQIAEAVVKSDSRDQFRFLWVGGGEVSDESLRFEHDVHCLGIRRHCRRVPTTANVTDYYYAMDVFGLTSREDPFPLVMLEASACHLPIVCFAQSGGGPEFVAEDAGLIAPYLNVSMFAKHLMALRDEPDARRQFGACAAEKVRKCHTTERQARKVLSSINRCLGATCPLNSDGACTSQV